MAQRPKDSPVVARLRSPELARSPIRRIMELADRDNIIRMGLDPDDVISFAGGWVDHRAPEALRDAYAAIADSVEAFHTSGAYSPTSGLPETRRALLRLEEEVYGVRGLELEHLIVGQSSSQLTYCLFTALLEPGDKVLLFDPAYANYGPQIGVLGDGIEVISVPVLDTATWRYFGDPDAVLADLEQALARERPKLLLLSSPDNPTGGLVPDLVFERLLELAEGHGCLVAVDYAYRAQCFAPQAPRHFAASPARHGNLVAIHSNSKWCRGLGRRLGWLVASPEVIDAVALVQQSMILCPDTLHQAALARYLEAALDDGSLRAYLQSSCERYAAAARHMAAGIDRHLGMRYVEPAGGLYTVIDVGSDGEQFVHDVLAATGVIFVPGAGFGATLARAVRASFGPLVNRLDRMEEGFERVADFLRRSSGSRGRV